MRRRLGCVPVFLVACVVLLAGCGTAAPTPTVNVAPTQTRAAELAQLATLTAPTVPPTETPTPRPTSTPAPTPTAATAPPTATPAVPPTPVGCRLADGRTAFAVLGDIYARWKVAEAVAAQTPRGDLAPQVSVLQEVQHEVDLIVWPPCASGAVLDLSNGMEAEVGGYIDFLFQRKPDATASAEVDAGQATLRAFETDLVALPH